MHPLAFATVAIVAFVAAWMIGDGIRALVTGQYTTPRSGAHAGQLGPWADLLRSVRLDARSRAVRVGFVVYGALYLLAGVAFVLGLPASAFALMVVAVLGLWYLPVGTLLNLAVIVLLVVQLAQR